ncbi:MAG: tRNA1(Val) (adenine(37)-N6)-methyltransferase [Lachnospiraceae bacterium]
MNNTCILDNERLDDLQNGCKIIQNPKMFCFGMDAVLLSNFAQIGKNEKVLDLGCGTGIIPILLRVKTQGRNFTGLEIQKDCADMARRSVQYNHFEDDISIVTGDIRQSVSLFGTRSFDVVTCNPPYMIGAHGLKNPEEAKAIARHEVLCTLEDVIEQASRLLVSGGRFYLVHRPFRLAEIISLLVQYKLEPKRMRLVHPYVDKEPNMVLLEARLGGNSRITVEKPLIVYEAEGVYTSEIIEQYGMS